MFFIIGSMLRRILVQVKKWVNFDIDVELLIIDDNLEK